MITVIGCDGAPPRPEAAAALAAAGRVVGTRRHLDSMPIPASAERVELKALDQALDTICETQGETQGRVVVLASGDPGFFGIVRAIRARGEQPEVIPAVSSVALAFARLGLDWDDALVVSAHGRDPQRAVAAALAHPKAAILTAPGTARELGAELQAGERTVYVAERLGTPEERIGKLTGADPAEPNVLIAIDECVAGPPSAPRWLAGHTGAPGQWALPEDAFEHRDSMITKAEIRALVLARLGPAPGRTIWDIGAGSGSVAVECARFGAWTVAVEQDPGQCRRIRRNAATYGVYLRVLEGQAPQALIGQPRPDAIFAGGGDNATLAAMIQTSTPDRVVVTLAAVDRVGGVTRLLGELGYRYDGVQLQASRLASLPNGTHRLTAQNPVFVVWGERG
ncbi:MAG: precorrin-6y C5,15-methyltransferase (decarboxylating) subunit CbiE [Streptosporangiaceae bacterium]|nr:precorrin-6y C5,15-methyltransferase (decarboxylating) subunit CbiE [Streptosporangiaceae bacterium]